MKYPIVNRLQQVHLGVTQQGLAPVTAYHGGKQLYVEEHEALQAALLKLCPPQFWYHGSHNASCARPILSTPEHQEQLATLHNALATAITDIVERWWTDDDAKFPERMPVTQREEELLRVCIPTTIQAMCHFC